MAFEKLRTIVITTIPEPPRKAPRDFRSYSNSSKNAH